MKNRNKQTKFPVARIKKIMQKDEEVGKVSQATPVVISKALELFLGMLVDEAARVTRERNSKRVESYHLKHAIERTDMLDFLKEIVAAVPDPSCGGTIDVDSGPQQQSTSRGGDRGDGTAFSAAASGSGAGTSGTKRSRRATGAASASAARAAAGTGDGAPRRRRKKGEKAAVATDAGAAGSVEIMMGVKELSTSVPAPASVSDTRGGFSANSYTDDYDYEPDGAAEGAGMEGKRHYGRGASIPEPDPRSRGSNSHSHRHNHSVILEDDYGEGEPEVESEGEEDGGGAGGEGGMNANDEWD